MRMFKQGDSSSREKMDGCFFQKILRQNVRCFGLNTENYYLEEVLF